MVAIPIADNLMILIETYTNYNAVKKISSRDYLKPWRRIIAIA